MSNLARVERVARKLDWLRNDVVFVGGAVVEFYVTRPVSEKVRATDDTDVVSSVETYAEYHEELGEKLRRLGFRQVPGDPGYRWRDDEDVLDVLTAEGVHGFTNRWYSDGIGAARAYALPSGLSIRMLPPAYYLATKIEAHAERGGGDPYTSRDFEDIVYTIANRPEIFAEIGAEGGAVSAWVVDRLGELFPPTRAAEYLTANLRTGSTGEVVAELKARLADLSGSSA